LWWKSDIIGVKPAKVLTNYYGSLLCHKHFKNFFFSLKHSLFFLFLFCFFFYDTRWYNDITGNFFYLKRKSTWCFKQVKKKKKKKRKKKLLVLIIPVNSPRPRAFTLEFYTTFQVWWIFICVKVFDHSFTQFLSVAERIWLCTCVANSASFLSFSLSVSLSVCLVDFFSRDLGFGYWWIHSLWWESWLCMLSVDLLHTCGVRACPRSECSTAADPSCLLFVVVVVVVLFSHSFLVQIWH